ncbi:MAG TPA: hypothetical protein VE967_04820 [Gemmatimonadaceae bacterium]|nr:hypothetical protein [Gemmatimonadaceae bacterium]
MQRQTFLRIHCAFGLAVSLATCGGSDAVAPGASLALGTWGGDNAAVIATDTVTHVHVACTFGDMPANIALDAEGRFTVDGTFVLRAYPVYVGPTLPAQFSGRVQGSRLTLAIAVNDTVEKKIVALGPVTVTLGKTPQMGPCPICSVPRKVEFPPTRQPIDPSTRPQPTVRLLR